MAKSKNSDREKFQQPELIIPRASAAEKISVQIEKGRKIQSNQYSSEGQIDAAWDEYKKWHSYNIELLTRIFSNTAVADEYSHVGPSASFGAETFLSR